MKRRLIVLMGLDGSGKSTQAQLLANRLREQNVNAEVVWMRGESYVSMPLIRIGRRLLGAPGGKKRGDVDVKHRRERASQEAVETYENYVRSKQSVFRNGLMRVVWRYLVLFDFFITFKVSFAKLAKDVEAVILDRYIYDSLIDIDSAFGSDGAEVKRLLRSPLLRLFPQPDKVVLLEIAPGDAMRRKDDIPSMDYLEERLGLYRIVADELKASIIDATRPIQEVRVALVDAVRTMDLGKAGVAGTGKRADGNSGKGRSRGAGTTGSGRRLEGRADEARRAEGKGKSTGGMHE